jgi:hypothetical protein
MDNHIILKCPNCLDYVLIYKSEFNCKIFRHAYYKENYKQIDPHMKEEDCMRLKKQGIIYGCAMPFKLINEKDEIYLEKCDYI